MKALWRRIEPRNPWGDEDPLLSGWVPGIAPQLDMLAMITSIARSQWQLSETQVQMARLMAFSGWFWTALTVLNIYWVGRALGWW